MPSYQYRNSHCKDKTVSWPSYLYNENPDTWKDSPYIETMPWFLFCLWLSNPLSEAACTLGWWHLHQFEERRTWSGTHSSLYYTQVMAESSWNEGRLHTADGPSLHLVNDWNMTARLEMSWLENTWQNTARGYPAKRALSAMRKHGG